MKRMNDVRVGTRLGFAFALLVFAMLAMAFIARMGLSSIGGELDLLVKDRYVKVKLVNEIADELNLQSRAMRNLLIMDGAAERGAELATIEKSRAAASALYARLEPLVTSPEGKSLLAEALGQRARFGELLAAYLGSVRSGDLAGARTQLLAALRPQQLAYMASLDKLTALQERLMDDAGRASSQTVDRVSMLVTAFAVLGLALACAAGVVVTRSVVHPLRGVVGSLNALAAGDLAQQVRVDRHDELGDLQRALAATIEALRGLVLRVRTGVDSVTTAAGQIAAGNQDLSSRTEEQASSLQQTASSMEQITGTVRNSEQNAQQASRLAAEASQAAQRGGDAVREVVDTMNEIAQRSHRIVDIIGVIDGIAFQTNILALNAAVEAARAGEQGRGFAVVASEVRTLAQRSADAAKEIKTLIGSSVEKVEAGNRQVADAGETMQEIVAQVGKVAGLIDEIAGSSHEESTGIQQVNQAVAMMDQVTQQNAALVEESAAAAASLEQQAKGLAEAVSAFRIAA